MNISITVNAALAGGFNGSRKGAEKKEEAQRGSACGEAVFFVEHGGWREAEKWNRFAEKRSISAPLLSPPRLCVNHSELAPSATLQAENFRAPARTVIRFTPASAAPFCRTLAKNRHSLVALAGVSSTAM